MVDPQSQTLTVVPLVGAVMELCMLTAVLCGGRKEPTYSKWNCGLSPAEPRGKGWTSEGT